MKDFLNRYMATNRHLKKQSEGDLAQIFEKTTSTILEGIGMSSSSRSGSASAPAQVVSRRPDVWGSWEKEWKMCYRHER